MSKNGKRADAEIRGHVGAGVEVQFFYEGELAYGRLWACRADALAAADAKRRELERRAWTEVSARWQFRRAAP